MHLLRLLADGGLHSGEELGARLGISRTAVWKQLAAWRKRGLIIDVVPGKGYRLAVALECWDEAGLLAGLDSVARNSVSELVIEERVGSTNDVVLERLRACKTSGVICLAEEQVAGRGRRGREWLSPFGVNFYGSVGWVFSEVALVEGLSLAVGVAVIRALKRYGMNGAQLKWPNDIVVGEAKLGGVLIELQAEAQGPCLVVIGLGLNLHLPDMASKFLGRPVTDVCAQTPFPLRRNELGSLLLSELLLLLRDYTHHGFAGVRDEWLQHDALRDMPVVVTGLDRELSGIARGVNLQGALQVEMGQEMMAIHGGEVSLRKRPE